MLSFARIRSPGWLLLLATMPACALVVAAAFQPWVPPSRLFRDALSVAERAVHAGEPCCSWYMGLLSNLGILLWAATAAVCVFTSLVLYVGLKRTYPALFFLCGGALTGWLMLDDLFLMHETWGAINKAWGAYDIYFFGTYALLLLIYLIVFRQFIFEIEPFLLILSLAMFVVAVSVDLSGKGESALHWLGEDGTKFMGISLWMTFFLRAAWLTIVRNAARDT